MPTLPYRIARHCVLIIGIALLSSLPVHAQASPFPLTISPAQVRPGDVVLITVANTSSVPTGTLLGKPLHFNQSGDGYRALIGIDLQLEPGVYSLDIQSGAQTQRRDLQIAKKEFPVQRLTLPKAMAEPSPENEARAEREQKRLSAIWPLETERMWSGTFLNPRNGEVSTKFGLRRIINGMPKNPHTGVDIAAEPGMDVVAPNDGTAVLAEEHFFSGNSIVIDHGQGIFTMFFHLSKMLVVPGQLVRKGDVIGLVGSTGRSTGAHLHWGARIQGSRVDPLALLSLDLQR